MVVLWVCFLFFEFSVSTLLLLLLLLPPLNYILVPLKQTICLNSIWRST